MHFILNLDVIYMGLKYKIISQVMETVKMRVSPLTEIIQLINDLHMLNQLHQDKKAIEFIKMMYTVKGVQSTIHSPQS